MPFGGKVNLPVLRLRQNYRSFCQPEWQSTTAHGEDVVGEEEICKRPELTTVSVTVSYQLFQTHKTFIYLVALKSDFWFMMLERPLAVLCVNSLMPTLHARSVMRDGA